MKTLSGNAFAERMERLSKLVKCRLLTTPEELKKLAQLRYRGYVASGMVSPGDDASPEDGLHDGWDEIGLSYSVGMFVFGRMVGSMRVHVNRLPGETQEHMTPSCKTFGDVLEPYIDKGVRFIDPTRFVIEPGLQDQDVALAYYNLRIACVAAAHFDVHYIISSPGKRHAAWYRHVSRHRAISEPRSYPGLTEEIVCMMASRDDFRDLERRFPYLRSTPEEQVEMFGPKTWIKSSGSAMADVA